MQVTFAAHPPNDHGKPHSLIDHLISVGELSADFAAKFGAAELGRWAGRWHDVGKFNPRFQKYLMAEEGGGGPDHKAAGALLALEHFSPLSFVICGHHGGLPSLQSLKPWLKDKRENVSVQATLRQATAELPQINPVKPLQAPSWLSNASKDAAELFIRMLFSVLVDADFLDTEMHCCPENARIRTAAAPGLEELEQRFLLNVDRALAHLPGRNKQARMRLINTCAKAAQQDQGMFTLPLPAGDDRTSGALAFALRHCITRPAERIIFAVSPGELKQRMIEVYKYLSGRDRVLPATTVPIPLADCPDNPWYRSVCAKLACENWKAPVVITTTSHLFASLFSSQPARCRKLHNICQSVLILDDFQNLPPRIFGPITCLLRELVEHYGVSLLLASERLPALEKTNLAGLLSSARPITGSGARPRIRRHYIRCELQDNPVPARALANMISSAYQVLAISNSKSDTLTLLNHLESEATFHLSSLLCRAHRNHVLSEIRVRLRCDLPCRVVATQMLDLGLRFPLVLRAMAPLDNLLGANRCCRSGPNGKPGKLIIFEPEIVTGPAGVFSSATAVTRNLLRRGGPALEDPDLYENYWRTLLGLVDQDGKKIQEKREAFDFPAVSEQFPPFDTDTEPVVVHYVPPGKQLSPATSLLERVRSGIGRERELGRLLKGYTVPIYRSSILRYQKRGLVVAVFPGLWEWRGEYDHGLRGIQMDSASFDCKEAA